MEEITSIFNEIKKMYPTYNLLLASGGLCDVKGTKSDVDISLYHKDYSSLHSVFKNSTASYYAEENAAIYSIEGYPREVNIYASDSIDRINMGIKHRENELRLNKYPLLVSAAIALKRSGEGTESAWMKALQLEGYPYEIMARDDIEDIAKIQEIKMKSIIESLSTK